MLIQYVVLGFEPTTFWTRVSPITNRPRAPALAEYYLGGDEQLDRPNSQTTMKLCHPCDAYIFWVVHTYNSFLLGPIQPSSYTT